ncbi:cellulose binding iron reductase [Coprinellus micaceus]|uniref:Cellulose binding iron reductase n=1 Tax=Coprinellus micaceus TaxID=71717 RepID=A0A4Y7T305_COPMI|nr:cellulose binding iron reductase [Coprinellus micaceus]
MAWLLGVSYLFALQILLAVSQTTRRCDGLTSACFQVYYEEHLDTAWGYMFPPTGRDEFVGLFIAPIRSGWIGNSLGGSMRRNLLIVGWLDDNDKAMVSSRMAPSNCTTWTGGTGGINLSGVGLFGYATHAAIKPVDPSNPSSSLYQHTEASMHDMSPVDAQSSTYDIQLAELLNAPPLLPPKPTTTTDPNPTPTEPALCPGAPRPTYPVFAAKGWKVSPVLGRLAGAPRQIMVDSKGHLLVLQRDIGVTGHEVDSTGCLMWNSFHITRSVHVSRKYPDFISLSVGSEGNLDLPSFDPIIGRSQIRTFDMRKLPEGGVAYNSSYGKVLGYGLRNCVGVTEDRAGTVFAVENSLDDAHRIIDAVQVDIHEDNPAEKIYRLGTASSPNESFFGGYPYCYSVWNEADIPNADPRLDAGDYFVQDPNGKYTDAWCNVNSAAPEALLPPHAAPLDIKFGVRPDDTNLYVALHGSSARAETLGYKVVAIPGTYSEAGGWIPTLDLTASKRGTTDIFFNHNETECRGGCFRPCGMAFAPNGDLYVSSDTSGEVFLLKPPPAAGPATLTGAVTGSTQT